MRIFLAGATGVIGRSVLPLLVADGHVVAGMTRSPANVDWLRAIGAEPVVCDVFDRSAVIDAIAGFGPELVMHQLTDLPDSFEAIGDAAANSRIRRAGTDNLIAAFDACGAHRFLAQSIAWDPAEDGTLAKAHLERAVLAIGGVVARYGQFYGPGTYHPDGLPKHPRVSIETAARRTVELVDSPSGVVTIVD